MTKIDLMRRAEIGRERRARTRSQILEAATLLLAERPLAAVTVDSVVEAAGVAKGTFYYHFQSMEELGAAVGTKLAETFDDLLAQSMRSMPDPVARLSFGIGKFLDRAISDPPWTRLVIQSSHTPGEFDPRIRQHLRADIAEAIAAGRLAIKNADLGVNIVIGIWLQVARSTLQRPAIANLAEEARAAMLRALGVSKLPKMPP